MMRILLLFRDLSAAGSFGKEIMTASSCEYLTSGTRIEVKLIGCAGWGYQGNRKIWGKNPWKVWQPVRKSPTVSSNSHEFLSGNTPGKRHVFLRRSISWE